MVAKSDILTAKARIEEALHRLVQLRTCDKFHVFESDWGHLRALIGSDAFKGKNAVERQEIVWDWLREQVDPENLVFLYGVHPMDRAEYDSMVEEK